VMVTLAKFTPPLSVWAWILRDVNNRKTRVKLFVLIRTLFDLPLFYKSLAKEGNHRNQTVS
jgi:hypothetical protein